jgi:predicted kinase
MTLSADPAHRAVPRPLALLVCGAPGSGKSTVGALIARRLRAALLDLDTATAELTAVVAAIHGTDDLDDPGLARLTRVARYETLTRLAEDSLACGVSTVLVAPFTAERRDRRAWDRLQRRIGRTGATTSMVWLRISADEVLHRVRGRGAVRDLAKLTADWPAGLDLDPPDVPHLAVDASLSPELITESVLSTLQEVTDGDDARGR